MMEGGCKIDLIPRFPKISEYRQQSLIKVCYYKMTQRQEQRVRTMSLERFSLFSIVSQQRFFDTIMSTGFPNSRKYQCYRPGPAIVITKTQMGSTCTQKAVFLLPL